MRKQPNNKKHIQRQDGRSMEDTSFYSATDRAIDLKFCSGTGAASGFAQNGSRRDASAGPVPMSNRLE